MKTIICLIIGLGLIHHSYAQLNLERQVLSTAGEVQTSGQLSLSSTVGEPMVATIIQGTLVLNQGFQQGELVGSVSIDAEQELGLRYHIYPNPTLDKITVTLEHASAMDLTLSVIDVAGRKVLPDRKITLAPDATSTEIDVTALASGVYHLVLYQGKNGSKAVFKIEKL